MKDLIDENDNFKIFQEARVSIFILILVILLILFGIVYGIYKLLTPNIIILDKDNYEVNSLYACCTDIIYVNYFENYSNETDLYASTLINKSKNYGKICLPQNELKYIEFPCYYIEKKEIDIEWLELNAECISIDKPCENLECKNGGKCSKYKFGNYTIEIK